MLSVIPSSNNTEPCVPQIYPSPHIPPISSPPHVPPPSSRSTALPPSPNRTPDSTPASLRFDPAQSPTIPASTLKLRQPYLQSLDLSNRPLVSVVHWSALPFFHQYPP